MNNQNEPITYILKNEDISFFFNLYSQTISNTRYLSNRLSLKFSQFARSSKQQITHYDFNNFLQNNQSGFEDKYKIDFFSEGILTFFNYDNKKEIIANQNYFKNKNINLIENLFFQYIKNNESKYINTLDIICSILNDKNNDIYPKEKELFETIKKNIGINNNLCSKINLKIFNFLINNSKKYNIKKTFKVFVQFIVNTKNIPKQNYNTYEYILDLFKTSMPDDFNETLNNNEIFKKKIKLNESNHFQFERGEYLNWGFNLNILSAQNNHFNINIMKDNILSFCNFTKQNLMSNYGIKSFYFQIQDSNINIDLILENNEQAQITSESLQLLMEKIFSEGTENKKVRNHDELFDTFHNYVYLKHSTNKKEIIHEKKISKI